MKMGDIADARIGANRGGLQVYSRQSPNFERKKAPASDYDADPPQGHACYVPGVA